MAPSVCPVLLLTVLLSLVVTPYLLPRPWSAEQDGKKVTTLQTLWKATDELPYFHPQPVSRRTWKETFAKPEIGDLGVLHKNIPKEEVVLPS
ncbi:galanin-like peptide [Phyllostomus hastatus]|uniref:galanin-like peptide n=1 Tax=Phyllostomus hastatus TaxID=9423 RepID=UPI001E680B00|nr:galanin-like peptide [Phyllostomus hastatus]